MELRVLTESFQEMSVFFSSFQSLSSGRKCELRAFYWITNKLLYTFFNATSVPPWNERYINIKILKVALMGSCVSIGIFSANVITVH